MMFDATKIDYEKIENCKVCRGLGYILSPFRPDEPNAVFDPKSEQWMMPCLCTKEYIDSQRRISRRMPWDSIWMRLALDISSRSICKVPDRDIGCVIVSQDNTKVLALGYNGTAKGDSNQCDYDGDVAKMGTSRCTCAHAEMNALTKLDTSNPIQKTMYLTLSPCMVCANLIINAGINEVVYMMEYKPEPLLKLVSAGVRVRKFEREDDRN